VVVLALLAAYALARLLLKSEAAALVAGTVYALFFLLYLGPSIFTFGGGVHHAGGGGQVRGA